jgi:DNA (cytosine-5)-methyltransferase 1
LVRKVQLSFLGLKLGTLFLKKLDFLFKNYNYERNVTLIQFTYSYHFNPICYYSIGFQIHKKRTNAIRNVVLFHFTFNFNCKILRTKKIKLLDLCCKAGGCSVGYFQAAQDLGIEIEITGVDIEPQPNYPFKFIQADALTYVKKNYKKYTHLHFSPPCQGYSNSTAPARSANPEKQYSRLCEDLRDFARTIEIPSVIENVLQAPIRKDIVLNGDMFKLKVLRSRKFEINNWFMLQPLKPKKLGTVKGGQYAMCVGNGQLKVKNGVPFDVPGSNIIEVWGNAMDIDWMQTREELKEAIPPAYTRYIGYEFFKHNVKMITEIEKQAIKQNIGKHYSVAIIERFNAKGIKPKEADKWTMGLVKNLVNGFSEHQEAEMEILLFASEKKKEKELLLKKRKQLIQ